MRRLGQHFLINKAAIKKIIAALDLQEGDTVIEIGPGHGELTLELLEFPINLIAIEKDKFLAEKLQKIEIRSRSKFGTKFEILVGDALKIIPQLKIENPAKGPRGPRGTFRGYKLKIVGNIPYYITGHLLRVLSELENKPSLTVLTVQKEVAERIAAQPPRMNRLAAVTQFWAKPEIIATLEPKDFSPPPKVDSAIIKLKSLLKYPTIVGYLSDKKYYDLVKILFQQPRKTILNNLLAGLKISKEKVLEKIKESGLTGQERPQDLNIKKIEELADLFFARNLSTNSL